MKRSSPHLFVDISSHGFGHLAQTAPVLNALHDRRPDIELTIRCGLPEGRLRERIRGPFRHLAAASDFGFEMLDALRIDRSLTAHRYRALHHDWAAAVAQEARLLQSLAPDFVFSNVAYLPLAGAASAGIAGAAMCSLNWGDLFAHYFVASPDGGDQTDSADDWARRINLQISAAYAAHPFLEITPAMPVAAHPLRISMPPVAEVGHPDREALNRLTDGAPRARRFVLVAFGGIPMRFPVAHWPQGEDIVWLLPQSWPASQNHLACRSIEACGLRFSDLLASVDAVVTKPGYGTFVEAACCGTPVLYLRRDDWPEQDVLIDWLQQNAPARELPAGALSAVAIELELEALWQMPAPPRPLVNGAEKIANWLEKQLRT